MYLLFLRLHLFEPKYVSIFVENFNRYIYFFKKYFKYNVWKYIIRYNYSNPRLFFKFQDRFEKEIGKYLEILEIETILNKQTLQNKLNKN